MQAIRGHVDLMSRRRPVDDVIQDADSPEELRRRLALVNSARDFAVTALQLPDNKSYRSYADLERDYVVWNVFAAPEFSLEPKRWCFPVAGCVAYRGYFSEAAARAYAMRLDEDGFDTLVGGVSAYSTLGRFADPVLNTMMRWTDVDLISTMFHELAHQKLYVRGDSAFNESFATAVAEFGLERWLKHRGEPLQASVNPDVLVSRQQSLSLVAAAREALNELYAMEMDNATKRERKQEILNALSADVGELSAANGLPNWLAPPLNNARLVSINLYEGSTNIFRRVLDQCAQELSCFYRRAEELAELEPEQRHSAVAQSVNWQPPE